MTVTATQFTRRSDEDIAASFAVALAPSTDGRFVVRHNAPNESFFYLGDTAWELFHRLSYEEAEVFLRNRAEKGFNVVMAVVLAEQRGLDLPNREGHLPLFTPPGSALPSPTHPNPDYFLFIDRVVALAASLGIAIAIVPTWGCHINGGLHRSPVLFDEESAYEYAKFLGQRYPFQPFVLGGDTNRWWNEELPFAAGEGQDVRKLTMTDWGPITEAMAKGIQDGEGLAKQTLAGSLQERAESYKSFITYHSTQGWNPDYPCAMASVQFPDAEWLSLDCVQSGHSDELMHPPSAHIDMWFARNSYIPVREMYSHSLPNGKPRPVIDLEPHYEATHYHFDPSRPMWNADDIRAGGWQALFSGACGYTYGVNSIWQMYNAFSTTHGPNQGVTLAETNWFYELDLPGSFHVGVMRKIMLSLPNYFSRVPDQDFIVSSTNELDPHVRAGDKLVTGTRADEWALVHLPYGGSISIDLAKALPGNEPSIWRAWWVDTKCGARELCGSGNQRGIFKATTTTSGTLKDDCLLLVETFATVM